jgi:EamA domain-containing membrane protein RarD
MEDFSKHITHYVALFAVLFAGVAGFWVFSYERLFQAAVAVSVAVSYVVWGIVHHTIHKDLTGSVIVEYILIATLGLIIVFSLIFSA